jgi:hypothetical protein
VSEAVGNSRVYSFALHTSEHINRSLENATSVQKSLVQNIISFIKLYYLSFSVHMLGELNASFMLCH